MMKSIRTLVRQDQEKYVIPRRVQDVIPIQKIWEDGIFLTGGRYAKTFRFTDINYQVASEPDKEKMFRGYSALINSLDCGATTKITIFNHKMSQINCSGMAWTTTGRNTIRCFWTRPPMATVLSRRNF